MRHALMGPLKKIDFAECARIKALTKTYLSMFLVAYLCGCHAASVTTSDAFLSIRNLEKNSELTSYNAKLVADFEALFASGYPVSLKTAPAYSYSVSINNKKVWLVSSSGIYTAKGNSSGFQRIDYDLFDRLLKRVE